MDLLQMVYGGVCEVCYAEIQKRVRNFEKYFRKPVDEEQLRRITKSVEAEFEDLSHYSKLYEGLSENERRFIVSQWDGAMGLESWQERLRKLEERRERQRRWNRPGLIALQVMTVVFILAGVFLFWKDYSNARDARKTLDYIYSRAPENESLAAGLKWVDEEMAWVRERVNESK